VVNEPNATWARSGCLVRVSRFTVLAYLVAPVLVACEPVPVTPGRPAAVAEPTRPAATIVRELDARFVAAVRTAAAAYPAWGRVDEGLRAAPIPCAAGSISPAPSPIRMSAAGSGPHGRKLYYLSASDRDLYLDGAAFPAGFAVVKESFAAVPVDPPRPGEYSMKQNLVVDGQWFTRGERRDLFVMTKLADPSGTDAGWIYGTVAVDGTVTGAGRIASCMACHDHDASRERLFGLAN
jgi:hypothetical protein